MSGLSNKIFIDASYPDYEKLIPTEFNCFAFFGTVEAIKAANSLKALSSGKDYPIDLTIGDGKIVMANPDDKGQAELIADTDGEVKIRVDGQYLAEALRACGGMVELKLTNGYSPMLFFPSLRLSLFCFSSICLLYQPFEFTHIGDDPSIIGVGRISFANIRALMKPLSQTFLAFRPIDLLIKWPKISRSNKHHVVIEEDRRIVSTRLSCRYLPYLCHS